MEYTIDKTQLYALIDEEVSKVADEAYGENGVSLYDFVVLTDKDQGLVYRFIDDAARTLASSCIDISKVQEPATSSASRKLIFNVPDFDTDMEETAGVYITRFIVLFACVEIFKSRRAQSVPEYTDRMQAALGDFLRTIRTRLAPTRA